MKRLLSIMTCVMTVLGMQAEVKTAWEGSEAISWNENIPGTQYELEGTTFTGLAQGDIISIYTTLTAGDYGNPQYVVTYKAGDSWSWTDLAVSVSDDGVITYTVESEQTATEIAERGLIFRGQAYTITKITVETPSGDEPQVNPDPDPTPDPQPSDEVELQPGVSGSVLDLDAFTADNYDTTTHTMTTESGWTGGQLWIGDDSQFGGSRLVVMTAEDAKLKVGVYYVGEGESELMDAKYTKRHVVELDDTKKIQKVLIQNQEAGTVSFVSMAIDPSEIETNATAIAVEVGLEAGATEGVTVTDESTGNTVQTAISEGTVTITPTAGVGYAVKRVVVEQLVNPSNADHAVLSGARQQMPGVGNYDAVSVTDNGDGTYSFDMPAASVRILTDFEFTFLAPTASYDGQTHLVTLTDENESGTQKMYYSTDGKASWTEYTEPFTVTKNTDVWTKATTTTGLIAVKSYAEACRVAAAPTISYVDGVNQVGFVLNGATTDYTAGTNLYYTLDGTMPTNQSSEAWSDPISFPITTTVVKAIAVDAEGNWSAVVEQEVEYARYLTVDKEWVTFYSPETFAVPEGLKAYTVAEVQYTDGETGTLVLEEQSVIAANTPMLIENANADSETEYRVYSSDATITGTPCSEFKGTDTEMTITPTADAVFYVLADGIFQRSTSGTLAARNCYLELNSNSKPAAARSFNLWISGGVTGIGAVSNTQQQDDCWYGLNGMRLSQPVKKGIYVHRGKKIVIK